MKDLEKLFELYSFDYIWINPNDIDNIIFEFIPEEVLVDFRSPQDYLGRIRFGENLVEVYYDKKITSGDVIFKYKSIQKERVIKLNNLRG